jgi:methionyl-tRNA formyltransferase
MNIIFMGTPKFALPSLQAISESKHNIKAVVTSKDVQKGRGLKVEEPPVKTLAKKLNLPIIQLDSLKSPDFAEKIRTLSPDIFVVVAFKILPSELLNIPPKGAINLHASLLPKYRGAAPINWAIINGEKETGISIIQLKPSVDTGDILFQEKVKISENDTYGTLSEKLSQLGAKALVKVLDKLEEGDITKMPQDDKQATKAPKIFPEVGEIDWNKDASSIRNLIHGLSPKPGASSFIGNKRIKILEAGISKENSSNEPGTIVSLDTKQMGIQTGSGILLPKKVQMEGKKILKIEQFLRGFHGKIGDKFDL